MIETQDGIVSWANNTFGSSFSNLSIAARACQEMGELLMCLAADDDDCHAVEECADIVIVLLRIADNHGMKLADAIDRKMAINRGRTWELRGNRHIKEP